MRIADDCSIISSLKWMKNTTDSRLVQMMDILNYTIFNLTEN